MKRLRLSDFVTNHARLFLVLNIAITVFFAFYAVNLRIHDDIMKNYLPKNHPEVAFRDEVSETFQGTDAGIVIVEADDVFSLPVLETIRNLTTEFAKIDGVAAVTSLTNTMDMRSDGDAMVVENLVRDKLDYTAEELKDLKEYTLSKDLYTGNLVSSDGKYSMIILKLSPKADSGLVSAAVHGVVERIGGEYQYYFTGIPFVSADGDTSAKQDLKIFLPVVILVVVAVLYLTFRSLRGVVLPMLAVLMSVEWTMGLLTMLGKELSTVGAAIPVILVAVGSAYGIHVMNEYETVVRSEADKTKKFVDGLNDITVPVFLSALTTIAGFISLATSDLAPIKDFGVFTAFGVLGALVTAYTFIPAVLVYLPYRPAKQSVQEKEGSLFRALGNWLMHRQLPIIAGYVILTSVCLALIPKLNVDTDYAGAFRPDSSTRKALDLVADEFGGGSILNIHFAGDLQSPFVLRQMKFLADEGEKIGLVKPLSYAELIEEANDVINGSKRIPSTHDKIASLGIFLEGQDQLSDYVTSDYTQGLLVFRMPETSAAKMKRVTDAVDTLLAKIPKTYYVVDKSEVDDPDFLAYLDAKQLEMVSSELQELVPDISQEELAAYLGELIHLDENQYLSAHADEIDAFLEEVLSEDYTGFPVAGGDVLRAEVKAAIARGTQPEELAEVLGRYNPQADPVDVEDWASYIADDWEALLADARSQALDDIALAIAGDSGVETQAAGILRDLWDTEVTLETLPAEYVDLPAVHRGSLQVKPTGAPVLFQILTQMLTSSQIESLAMSILLVLVLLIIQLSSIKLGLVAITPVVLTVIINFGIMAAAHIPLDAATTMIASVAMGTGIDYAIHFINRFQLEYRRNRDIREAVTLTLARAGKAITANALSVALGFFVLVWSSTVTVAYFGGLTALTMILNALTAILLLPCMLTVRQARKKAEQVQKGETFHV